MTKSDLKPPNGSKHEPITKVLLQLGLDGSIINSGVDTSVISSGQDSARP